MAMAQGSAQKAPFRSLVASRVVSRLDSDGSPFMSMASPYMPLDSACMPMGFALVMAPILALASGQDKSNDVELLNRLENAQGFFTLFLEKIFS
jgi:hypothetical protein